MRLVSGYIAGFVYRMLLGVVALTFAVSVAASDLIRVKNMSGTVQVRTSPDDAWENAAAGMAVAAPVEFRTLSDGSGVLVQAGSEFELKRDTHITLQAEPTDSSSGLVTKIKQWFGTVFYSVEHQPDQFSVETPFLVSTVKGTRFVIVSTQSSSIVTLTEGSLEVLDIASGKTQMLDPGDIAGVGAGQAGIQSFQQTPARRMTAATPEAGGSPSVMDDTSDSFENALSAIAAVASEEAFASSDQGEPAPGPGDDGGVGDIPGNGSGDDGGGSDDGSDDDAHGGHHGGGHHHGDDDDDDDDD